MVPSVYCRNLKTTWRSIVKKDNNNEYYARRKGFLRLMTLKQITEDLKGGGSRWIQ